MSNKKLKKSHYENLAGIDIYLKDLTNFELLDTAFDRFIKTGGSLIHYMINLGLEIYPGDYATLNGELRDDESAEEFDWNNEIDPNNKPLISVTTEETDEEDQFPFHAH